MQISLTRNKLNGTALITALFIVSLVAAAAVLIQYQLRTNIRRTELLLNNERAYHYSEGVIQWGKNLIWHNAQNHDPKEIRDQLPAVLPEITYQQTVVSGTLSDTQGRFNINNLTQKKYMPYFVRLILAASPDTDENKANAIAEATYDWIGEKDATAPDRYAAQNPPYQAPHQPMASVTELRLVDGMTDTLYNALTPHVTALPGITKININTATAPALASLGALSLSEAQSLVSTTEQTAFNTIEDFMKNPSVQSAKINAEDVTLVSDFFIVQAQITIADQRRSRYALLRRIQDTSDSSQASPYKVNILWQSEGIF